MNRSREAVSTSLALVLAASLAACATVVEDRVETALVDAGLPRGMAGCMAPIWADRLSVGQLRDIRRFAGAVRAEGRQLTAGALVDHARAWNDPEALLVVTGSAARCALR